MHIILIHGIWDSSKTMKYLFSYLENLGYSVHMYQYIPNDGSVSFDYLVEGFKNYVDDIKIKNNLNKLSIIGFSMGGIIARYYIQKYNKDGIIQKYISISSPHRGTYTSYFNKGDGVKELRPESIFIKKINTEKPNCKSLSIYTPFDLIIIPSNSSNIKFGENKIFFVLAHPLMLRSKKVFKYIHNFIKL